MGQLMGSPKARNRAELQLKVNNASQMYTMKQEIQKSSPTGYQAAPGPATPPLLANTRRAFGKNAMPMEMSPQHFLRNIAELHGGPSVEEREAVGACVIPCLVAPLSNLRLTQVMIS